VSEIRATWKQGQVVLDGPVNWPEGLRLVVEPDRWDEVGDDEGPMGPDEISRTLAAMEKLEPFDLTNEEAAELDSWEQQVNQYTIANMDNGLKDAFP
jgi:hypothetical protein